MQLMVKIDKIDREILRLLTGDGRLPNTALAERVGLSPSACLRRVQELERAGVIQGYRAVLNPTAVGIGFVAYVTVGLSDHSKASQEGFERSISLYDEVRECHNITGAVEYLLRVETTDLEAFKLFHTDRLGTLAQVHQMTTHVVMASPKNMRA